MHASFSVSGPPFRVVPIIECSTASQTVTDVSTTPSQFILTGTLEGCDISGPVAYSFGFNATEFSGQLQMLASVNLTPALKNVVQAKEILLTVTSLSTSSESVFGFGVQYSVLNMKGRLVPILVSEQGIGLLVAFGQLSPCFLGSPNSHPKLVLPE